MTDSKKVAILTNMIAPYRIPIYREIGRRFSTAIFHAGTEENRTTWGDVESDLPGMEIRKSAGFVIRSKRFVDGRFFDYRFTHITPGYFSDLVAFRPDAVISSEIGFRTMAA
ncbi:MAG: glycosyl transferase family 1, partial [Deltaproteobacteria bacterium]